VLALDSLLQTLDASDDVAYVLTPERVIVRTNAAWERFAAANGGAALALDPPYGALLDALLPVALRSFYVDAFTRAQATGERWEHDYECSSPERYRRFHMVAYPFDGALVVVSSLRIERPHDRPECPPDDAAYAVDGIITMCSHCRRVRHPAGSLRWDWVPDYVRAPLPNLSHGLCEPCYEFYWGDYVAEPNAPE
jgi:hypothetical protein